MLTLQSLTYWFLHACMVVAFLVQPLFADGAGGANKDSVRPPDINEDGILAAEAPQIAFQRVGTTPANLEFVVHFVNGLFFGRPLPTLPSRPWGLDGAFSFAIADDADGKQETEERGPDDEDRGVKELIERLGHDDWREREKAHNELIERVLAGDEEARDAVGRAALESDDAEIQSRARRIVIVPYEQNLEKAEKEVDELEQQARWESKKARDAYDAALNHQSNGREEVARNEFAMAAEHSERADLIYKLLTAAREDDEQAFREFEERQNALGHDKDWPPDLANAHARDQDIRRKRVADRARLAAELDGLPPPEGDAVLEKARVLERRWWEEAGQLAREASELLKEAEGYIPDWDFGRDSERESSEQGDAEQANFFRRYAESHAKRFGQALKDAREAAQDAVEAAQDAAGESDDPQREARRQKRAERAEQRKQRREQRGGD